MPVIQATQEAEIRRIAVQSQPRQIVCETLPRKNPSQKRAGGVTQGEAPKFKPQYNNNSKKPVHKCSQHIIHNSAKAETTQMSISGRMD
jgi:hypothetical protein